MNKFCFKYVGNSNPVLMFGDFAQKVFLQWVRHGDGRYQWERAFIDFDNPDLLIIEVDRDVAKAQFWGTGIFKDEKNHHKDFMHEREEGHLRHRNYDEERI